MKRNLIIIVMFSAFQLGIAQETNCADKEALLSMYLFENKYQKANESWADIKTHCVYSSEKSFQLGLQLQQYNIEMTSKENKEKEVLEIVKTYKLYDKVFPNNTNCNLEKSAMALYLNKVGNNSEIYSYLDQAFETQKQNFLNPEAIFVYLQLFLEKSKKDKVANQNNTIFNKYTDLVALIENNKEKLPVNIEIYDRVLVSMESLMKDFLISDAFFTYAKDNFQTKKNDLNWLKTVLKILSDKNDTSTIFETIATELHTNAPSAKSANYLANYNLNTRKQDKAIEFYKESLKLETNQLNKATTAYSIATLLSSSDKEKSKEMVELAIENNPKNGKYFIFLANLYANSVSDCGTNNDEKNAIYKLASNTVLKAIEVEPRLKGTSEAMSKSYLKNITTNNSNPKKVKLGCWINEIVNL